MEEVQWDRQSFVPKTPPPPGGSSSLLGPVLFVLVISLVGGAAYLYIKNNGIPEMGIQPSPQAQSNELMTRLDEMNARLEQLEKRLRVCVHPVLVSTAAAVFHVASGGNPGPVEFVLSGFFRIAGRTHFKSGSLGSNRQPIGRRRGRAGRPAPRTGRHASDHRPDPAEPRADLPPV